MSTPPCSPSKKLASILGNKVDWQMLAFLRDMSDYFWQQQKNMFAATANKKKIFLPLLWKKTVVLVLDNSNERKPKQTCLFYFQCPCRRFFVHFLCLISIEYSTDEFFASYNNEKEQFKDIILKSPNHCMFNFSLAENKTWKYHTQKSSLNGIQNYDRYYIGAVLYQLSYQANCELIICVFIAVIY